MPRPSALPALLFGAFLLASCGRLPAPAAPAATLSQPQVSAVLFAQALPEAPSDRLYARKLVRLPVVQKNGKRVGEVRVQLDIAKLRSGARRFSGVGQVTVTSTVLQAAEGEASVTLLNPDGSVRGSNQAGDSLRPDDFFGSDLFEVLTGSAPDPGDLGTRPYCAETQVRVTFANRVAPSSARFLAPVQTQVRVCSGQGDLGTPLPDVTVSAALTPEAGGLRPSVSLSGAPRGYSISGQFTFARNDGTCGSLLPGSENVLAPRTFESLNLTARGALLRNAPDNLTLVPVVHLYDDDGVMVAKNLDAPFACVGTSTEDGEDE